MLGIIGSSVVVHIVVSDVSIRCFLLGRRHFIDIRVVCGGVVIDVRYISRM